MLNGVFSGIKSFVNDSKMVSSFYLIDINTEDIIAEYKNIEPTPGKLTKNGIIGNIIRKEQKSIMPTSQNPFFCYSDNVALFDYSGKLLWWYDTEKYNKPLNFHHDADIYDNYKILSIADIKKVNKNPIKNFLFNDELLLLDKNDNIISKYSFFEHQEEYGIHDIVGLFNDHPECFDWFHNNTACFVGENKWYDNGDIRFKPTNVFFSSRQLSIFGIIDMETQEIVWKNDYHNKYNGEMIIGQHSPYMIPKGYKYEGNIMVFDNGGESGVGSSDITSKYIDGLYRRDYSRILIIDPISHELIWEFSPNTLNKKPSSYNYKFRRHDIFYSGFLSNATRLPDDTTLACSGGNNKIYIVNDDTNFKEIELGHDKIYGGMTYRSYYVSYDDMANNGFDIDKYKSKRINSETPLLTIM